MQLRFFKVKTLLHNAFNISYGSFIEELKAYLEERHNTGSPPLDWNMEEFLILHIYYKVKKKNNCFLENA